MLLFEPGVKFTHLLCDQTPEFCKSKHKLGANSDAFSEPTMTSMLTKSDSTKQVSTTQRGAGVESSQLAQAMPMSAEVAPRERSGGGKPGGDCCGVWSAMLVSNSVLAFVLLMGMGAWDL